MAVLAETEGLREGVPQSDDHQPMSPCLGAAPVREAEASAAEPAEFGGSRVPFSMGSGI